MTGGHRDIPSAEQLSPPHAMPGYITAHPIPRVSENAHVRDAIVAEMDWAEGHPQIDFEVGARITYVQQGLQTMPEVDGYSLIPVNSIIAWRPRS